MPSKVEIAICDVKRPETSQRDNIPGSIFFSWYSGLCDGASTGLRLQGIYSIYRLSFDNFSYHRASFQFNDLSKRKWHRFAGSVIILTQCVTPLT